MKPATQTVFVNERTGLRLSRVATSHSDVWEVLQRRTAGDYVHVCNRATEDDAVRVVVELRKQWSHGHYRISHRIVDAQTYEVLP
jgi:hypothetical protein